MTLNKLQIAELYTSIGKLITSSLEFDVILEKIMEEIHVYFEAENWSLMRLDPNTGELFFVIAKGIDARAVENIRLSPGEGIAGLVAASGESIFVPDTSKDTRFTNRVDRVTGFVTTSVMAVPIKYRDTFFGVIELINRNTGGIFSEVEHLILKSIADFAAIAFANAAIYEKAVMLGNTDPLTGLLNRVKLQSVVDLAEKCRDGRRRRRSDSAFAVASVVDIDRFKDINDRYGHRQGDAVLRETARRLRSVTRDEDLLFRIGGDEFLLLIFGDSEARLDRIADRLREDMETLSHFTMDGVCEVRFSFGTGKGDPAYLSDVIHRADMEMYRKKEETKQR